MQAPVQRQCSHVSTCELFPKFGLRGSLRVWQVFYCLGNFEGCARYRLSCEGRAVPASLLPNGRELNIDALVGKP
ncbi:hypothetical protein [Anaeromyxobacter oryzae]|uniref:Uncharacterized protein n=1 Tax=Anaeromyxobacter oryzae TaxID=2918170 RepID=A0ABM7WP10_9BACT|nr:hypothetical protein [Anaeromyxobacter oryzae]BDG01194.1 hypothetical protein AMOR_01900 [Anaeromyxobacter oryzae]